MTTKATEAALRDLTVERETAEDDLRETVSALRAKVGPHRAAERFLMNGSAAATLGGVAAAGLAAGLVREPRMRLIALAAAAIAAVLLFRPRPRH